MRKHIVIVTYNDYPAFEGLGERIKNISRVIRDHEHNVTILAPNIENRHLLDEQVFSERIIRINIYIPHFLKKNRVIARTCTMIMQTLCTPYIYLKYLRKKPINIIMAEQIYAVPTALMLKMFSRSKVYVDDICTVSDILQAEGSVLLSKVLTFFEKVLFKFCDGFIYTSAVSYQYYEERGVKPSILLANGVNGDQFVPVVKVSDTLIIFFNGSTYSSQNNAATTNFIKIGKDVMSRIKQDVHFRLICWPEYYLPENVKNDIIYAKKWLTFSGGVEKIELEIGHADIAILAYNKGHNLSGGVRLKALEYMACGKLIISTPEGVEGIKGLIPNTHYVLAESVDDIADIILEIVQYPEKIDIISQNARKFVLSKYDWKVTLEEYIGKLQLMHSD